MCTTKVKNAKLSQPVKLLVEFTKFIAPLKSSKVGRMFLVPFVWCVVEILQKLPGSISEKWKII